MTVRPRRARFTLFAAAPGSLPRLCCKFNHLHTCRLHGPPITEVVVSARAPPRSRHIFSPDIAGAAGHARPPNESFIPRDENGAVSDGTWIGEKKYTIQSDT